MWDERWFVCTFNFFFSFISTKYAREAYFIFLVFGVHCLERALYFKSRLFYLSLKRIMHCGKCAKTSGPNLILSKSTTKKAKKTKWEQVCFIHCFQRVAFLVFCSFFLLFFSLKNLVHFPFYIFFFGGGCSLHSPFVSPPSTNYLRCYSH